MKTFRYDTSKSWFKGNVHLHSTASDGGMSFPALAELYASGGYDFLFRTDHWVASDTSRDTEQYPLLWLDGVELDGEIPGGAWYHAVCLGRVSGLSREAGFIAGIATARAQGALIILAHPHWSGNTLDDVLALDAHGVEVYNHVCRWLNGKSNGCVHWEAQLRAGRDALAFAVDDSHLRPEHPGWNGGWIVVNAERCAERELMDAIRQGNFYSSCGPELHSLEYADGKLHVTMSPVQFVRLVGPATSGSRQGDFGRSLMTEATFEVPDEWAFAYLEFEDDSRRRAWTNPLFLP